VMVDVPAARVEVARVEVARVEVARVDVARTDVARVEVARVEISRGVDEPIGKVGAIGVEIEIPVGPTTAEVVVVVALA